MLTQCLIEKKQHARIFILGFYPCFLDVLFLCTFNSHRHALDAPLLKDNIVPEDLWQYVYM